MCCTNAIADSAAVAACRLDNISRQSFPSTRGILSTSRFASACRIRHHHLFTRHAQRDTRNAHRVVMACLSNDPC